MLGALLAMVEWLKASKTHRRALHAHMSISLVLSEYCHMRHYMRGVLQSCAGTYFL